MAKLSISNQLKNKIGDRLMQAGDILEEIWENAKLDSEIFHDPVVRNFGKDVLLTKIFKEIKLKQSRDEIVYYMLEAVKYVNNFWKKKDMDKVSRYGHVGQKLGIFNIIVLTYDDFKNPEPEFSSVKSRKKRTK